MKAELRAVARFIQDHTSALKKEWRDAFIILEKAVDERLEAIQKEVGPQGPAGPQGPQGEQGVPGLTGERGEKGDQGEKGDVGEKGEPGERGEQGPQGPQGERGERGEPGERGEKGDPGLPGERGPQGEQGPPGERGADGAPGERGEKGDPGEVGPAGPMGERGERGMDGAGIDAPVWRAGIYREGAIVQHHIGQYYRAKADTATEPAPVDDSPSDWERVGTAGFRMAKPYSESRTYQDDDLFIKDFGLFMWRQGKAQLLTGRGPRGERGEKGADGKDAPMMTGVLLDVKARGLVVQRSDGALFPVSLEPLYADIIATAKSAALVEVAEVFEAMGINK